MRVLSRIPGRLRLGGVLPPERHPAQTQAHLLEDELPERPGIQAARANPLTGSILVLYDASLLSEAAVQAVVADLLGHFHTNGAHVHDHDHEQCGHHHHGDGGGDDQGEDD